MKNKLLFPILSILFLKNYLSVNGQDSLIIIESINKGINYLNNQIDSNQILYLGLPLLIPITSYYDLPITEKIYSYKRKKFDTEEQCLFNVYTQMVEYEKKSTHYKCLENKMTIIDQINIFALYGPKAISKKKFFSRIDSSIVNKDYEITHTYFALAILKKTKYLSEKEISFQLQKIDSVWKSLIPDTEKKEITDLDIEIIALSLYGWHSEMIKKAHIQTLIQLQNNEGAWSVKGNEIKLMNDHSTILALWALLEWKNYHDKKFYIPSKLNKF